MRFLIDNALSPGLAMRLAELGHDAVHVRDIGLQHAPDVTIFDRAAAEDRVLVSADTDFGTLLASRGVQKPSVILFRGPGSRRPEVLAHAMTVNLRQVAEALDSGSIVTFEPSRVRIRTLPIGNVHKEKG
jgi:predicted nuclease of predicted toxin-antitoxin system